MPEQQSNMPGNLPDWLEWIEKLHPEEVELGLSRVREVADELGLLDYFLDSGVQVITIAGTNGKGSTAAMLERIACISQISVGCFTSPHFLRYNERIRIDGVEASDDCICGVFSEIVPHTKDNPLTYFEYGTLAALQAFKNAQVELVILEVGLGGRLDAVNIIDADIAIVTSIGIDHQEWLGDNREQIGFEKAGILRKNKPLVCGESDPPDSVIALTQDLATPLYIRDSAFGFGQPGSGANWEWYGQDGGGVKLVLSDLPEPHVPRESVASALQAVALFNSSLLTKRLVQSALLSLKLPGRFFKMPNKQAILDVAHNPDAANYLSKQIATLPVAGKIFAVFAVMADKDLDGILSALKASVDFWYLTELDLTRAASNSELDDLFKRHRIDAYRTMPTVEAALLDAERTMTEGDMLLVLGSFFTAAAALEAWGVRSLAELADDNSNITDLENRG
ncbi:MAG: bifunctional tetrahydrofolate synthase/dihydrofolate synthase [Pseudomonadales bacterium]|nr:bifunctional tetrahydrofolate synthase/dihydrofolate synthase [Pseudomonadales bacterium]